MDCWHAEQLGRKILDNMTDQGSRPYDQEELPCCDKVHQATSDTVSVELLLLFQHLITVGADMLNYEL